MATGGGAGSGPVESLPALTGLKDALRGSINLSAAPAERGMGLINSAKRGSAQGSRAGSRAPGCGYELHDGQANSCDPRPCDGRDSRMNRVHPINLTLVQK
jgi:hypothetical protein